MLTKDLLRFRRISDLVKPQFVNPENPELLSLAERLLDIYQTGENSRRGQLRELVAPLLNGWKDVKLAKGLHKIILDKCDFSHPDNFDGPALRKKVFANSAALLMKGDIDDLESYQTQVAEKSLESGEGLNQAIYADLPELEKLVKRDDFTPRALLERYNLVLAQSLLIYSRKLDLLAPEPDPVKMRNLCKYLKFFGLLATIQLERRPGESKKKNANLKVTIDGPASLFENTQKYGLRLATFFPAILALDKWRLDTEIVLKNQSYRLRLSDKTGLIGYYRHFGDYVPEEIALFAKLFKQKVKDWKILDGAGFLNLGKQQLVFPDFSFRNQDSSFDCHLELFHRWHATPLIQRLEHLDNSGSTPLLLGVDRFLANKPEIASRLESSVSFQNQGFLFRDFPGVDRVKQSLKKYMKEFRGNGDAEMIQDGLLLE